MALILPAILADTEQLIMERLQFVSSFAKRVHIDVMDGVYVPSHSCSLAQIAHAVSQSQTRCEIELHCMIHDPLAVIEQMIAVPHLYSVVLQKDTKNVQKALEELKRYRKNVGLAIPVEMKIDHKDGEADFFLVLAEGKPGYSGTPFQMEALKQIDDLRKRFPHKPIEVDGGVNDFTARACLAHGATMLVANSYIFKAADPIAAYSKLEHL